MNQAIGCDISKDSIDVYAYRTGHHFKIRNNEKGYRTFVKNLPDKDKLHICMEATGNYYEQFADYLAAHGYQISVVNPLKIKAYSKAAFSRTKTDKQDAKLIAHYCHDHKPKADYTAPDEQQYRIKRLLSHIKQLNRQKVSLKNRIANSKDEFVTGQLKQQLEETDAYLTQCRQRLAELGQGQTAEHIQSIPGIGAHTASVLLHYLTFHKFETSAQFTAFAGLAPQITQSGSSVRQKDRLSRLGNRTLKAALYMPAVVAYRIGLFKGLAERMKQKGKSGKQIIVAIMRKLACLAFTLWRKQEPYRCSSIKAV